MLDEEPAGGAVVHFVLNICIRCMGALVEVSACHLYLPDLRGLCTFCYVSMSSASIYAAACVQISSAGLVHTDAGSGEGILSRTPVGEMLLDPGHLHSALGPAFRKSIAFGTLRLLGTQDLR